MAFEPGDTFDRYVIEALLGEGGMGTVYRAFDPRLQRRVALKMLRADRSEDGAPRSSPEQHGSEADARMMRAARAAAALEHANCVAIFDVTCTRACSWAARASRPACAAYADVVKRWGAAKPRSKSGEEARSAITRLGCPR